MSKGGISRGAARLAAVSAVSLTLLLAASASHAQTGTPVSATAAGAAEAEPQQTFAPFDAVPAMADPAASAQDEETADTPDGETVTELGSGIASFYGRRFAGRTTASGEIFDPTQLTAAHRTLPFGSLVRVTNLANGRSVVVRINDRGPFVRGRVIDLSRAAAKQVGLIGNGHCEVELALLSD